MAKLVYKREKHPSIPKDVTGNDRKMVLVKKVASNAPCKVRELNNEQKPSANPLNWPADRNCDLSIAGLGGYNKFRKYPGKVFPNAAAGWRESAAESDRAAKKAAKPEDAELIQESL